MIGSKHPTEVDVTPEEAVIHIQKIFNRYTADWNSWNVFTQDRREAQHWFSFSEEVEQILKSVTLPDRKWTI